MCVLFAHIYYVDVWGQSRKLDVPRCRTPPQNRDFGGVLYFFQFYSNHNDSKCKSTLNQLKLSFLKLVYSHARLGARKNSKTKKSSKNEGNFQPSCIWFSKQNIFVTTRDMKHLKLGLCRRRLRLSFHEKFWSTVVDQTCENVD